MAVPWRCRLMSGTSETTMTAGDAESGPLQGLKVVECATVVAAPLSGRLLADFGAEVIHVEHPEKGDHPRHFGFTVDGVNPWWKHYDRNKKLVTLDISKPAGRENKFSCLRVVAGMQRAR